MYYAFQQLVARPGENMSQNLATSYHLLPNVWRSVNRLPGTRAEKCAGNKPGASEKRQKRHHNQIDAFNYKLHGEHGATNTWRWVRRIFAPQYDPLKTLIQTPDTRHRGRNELNFVS